MVLIIDAYVFFLLLALAYPLAKDVSCRHACEYIQFQSEYEAENKSFSKNTFELTDAKFVSRSDIGS